MARSPRDRAKLDAIATAARAKREKINAADQIKAYRESRTWTQTELGEAAGYSQGQISQWENGANMDLEHVADLAAAFGVTVKRFLFAPPGAPETIEDIYDALPPEKRDDIIAMVRALKERSQTPQ